MNGHIRSLTQKYNTIIITAYIISQSRTWFVWTILPYINFLFSFIFIILFFINSNRKISLSDSSLLALILVMAYFLCREIAGGIHGTTIITFLVCLNSFFFYEEEKRKTIEYLTNILAVIVVFSLPFWLFHVFVSPLPVINRFDLHIINKSVIMDNHFFFVAVHNYDLFRFYSLFDEPGVLGTLGSLLLFINRYDFKKKQNILILIGCIFTYSFAFYLLTLFGMFYFYSKSIKKIFLLLLLVICIGGFLLVMLKNETVFQIQVVSRFSSLNTGVISKRAGNRAASFFDDFIKSNELFYGKGKRWLSENYLRIGVGGDSYYYFIVEYGMIGTILLLLLYISLIRDINKDTIFLLLMFMLSFLQRPQAFWPWQVLLFSCGTGYLTNNKYRQLSHG